MNTQQEFDFLCRGLQVGEALLLQAQTGAYSVLAAHGIPPSRRRAAARVAADILKNRVGTRVGTRVGKGPANTAARRPRSGIHRGVSPFRSRYVVAIPTPAGRAENKGLLLAMGARRGGDGARRLAGVLLRQAGAHLENRLLRERVRVLRQPAMLGELLLHTAHELGNPLANIVAYAELLNGCQTSAGRGRTALARIHAEAGRALEIERGMLSLANRKGATAGPVEWSSVVRRAFELRADPQRLAGIDVTSEWGSARVRTDPVRMIQAVLNILLNAEQALEGQPGPRRLFSRMVIEKKGFAVLEIANSGPPISPQILPKIFEPFFTTKPSGRGTGLGLAMARDAVMESGGRISVQNLAAGELFHGPGVRFRIVLPLCKESNGRLGRTAPAGAGEAVNGNVAQCLRGYRVLIVEDERELGRLLREMLAQMGCRASVRFTADRALAESAAKRYDLLICDLKLPGRDGRWLFEQLQRRRPELARRTLFITGDTISPPARRFLHGSGQPVLPKPFRLSELAEAVQRLLDSDPGNTPRKGRK